MARCQLYLVWGGWVEGCWGEGGVASKIESSRTPIGMKGTNEGAVFLPTSLAVVPLNLKTFITASHVHGWAYSQQQEENTNSILQVCSFFLKVKAVQKQAVTKLRETKTVETGMGHRAFCNVGHRSLW